jgi:hypothetical protein
MVTRYFDKPVPVLYLANSSWRRVFALAVRRLHNTYMVLIAMGPPEQEQLTAWVPRSQVRPQDAPARSAC